MTTNETEPMITSGPTMKTFSIGKSSVDNDVVKVISASIKRDEDTIIISLPSKSPITHIQLPNVPVEIKIPVNEVREIIGNIFS